MKPAHNSPDDEFRRMTRNARKSLNRRPKTKMKDIPLILLRGIIYPIYWLVMGIIWLWNHIVYEDIRTGDNGILGPGYHVYYTTKVSWGKISFCLLIMVVIVIGIIYIYY